LPTAKSALSSTFSTTTLGILFLLHLIPELAASVSCYRKVKTEREQRKLRLCKLNAVKELKGRVAGHGIEPWTQGFSVLCSTD
jgi:hypothetical protein